MSVDAINVLTLWCASICSGKNLDDSPTTIVDWNPKAFNAWKRNLKKYAKTCYTPAQFRAASSAALSGGSAAPGNLNYDLSALGGHAYDSDDAEDDDAEDDESEDERSEDGSDDNDESAPLAGTKRGRGGRRRVPPGRSVW